MGPAQAAAPDLSATTACSRWISASKASMRSACSVMSTSAWNSWLITTCWVMHRLTDLSSAGADGSHQVQFTEGLLPDTEIKVIYGQPASSH